MTFILHRPSDFASARQVRNVARERAPGLGIPEELLHGQFGEAPSNPGFAALRLAFRQSGGIADGDDLARLLEDHRLDVFVSLERLIGHDNVFGFTFHASFWIPMFQFDLRDLSPRRGAGSVVAELGDVPDGWVLATWFVRPNSLLEDRRPVDVLGASPAAVLAAAGAWRHQREDSV